MARYTKQTFRIYWHQTKKYRGVFLLIFLAISIGSVTNLIAPLFYKQFFDVLSGTGDIAGKIAPLKNALLKVLAIYLVSWVFWRTSGFGVSYFQTHIMADLMNDCFAYVHKHSVTFFNNNFVGSLVKKVNRFSHSFETIADLIFWDLLPITVDIIMIVTVLGRKNLLLGSVVLLWVIVYLLINYIFSRYKLKFDVRRATLNSKVTGMLADTITNHLNVKLFNGYEQEKSGFRRINSQYQKLQQFTWNLANYFEGGQALMMTGLELGVMYYAVSLWQRGILSVGDFVLLQAYLLNIILRLWNFGRIIRKYYEALADAEEMTEILETPHEIQDIPGALPLMVNKGTITFENVVFSYNMTRKVIKDLNLKIGAREKIALVGPSGSGKSTIINLLPRNYDLTGGQISIDGQKISHVTQETLWQNIALVNQDPILFHRTLKENIRYGRPNAPDSAIIKAAQQANAHDFINSLSDGYYTYVGERGVKLSGGERQRVAIARAILKNAPILVLDEATSSLDSESEELIQDALVNLMQDKTVIVIAHRLSTIMKMDRIIVLNEGEIIEQGTHVELVSKKGGLYKRLWEKQIGGFIE
ncbi:MAG: ABC transporter ATP-binding protein [Patescibacteria group bacterium]